VQAEGKEEEEEEEEEDDDERYPPSCCIAIALYLFTILYTISHH
jgi:hypothetical protein